MAVWLDRESLLSRSLTFHQEIKDAIRTAVSHLVYVGGPAAAKSQFVAEEWRQALEYDHVTVVPILRIGTHDDVPPELGVLHCEDFRDEAGYASSLQRLIASLTSAPPPLGRLFAVPPLPAHFLPRRNLMEQVSEALLADVRTPRVITSGDSHLGMHGMGGMGKSVLACALARQRSTRLAFPDGIVWITVGQNTTRNELLQHQRDIAKHLGLDGNFDSLPQGLSILRDGLAKKAILLVVDDVWHASDFLSFDVLGSRSRSLLTTRDAGVLRSLHGQEIRVPPLAWQESMQLLAEASTVQESALPLEALQVAVECGGSPLALVLSGRIAWKKSGDFRSVLDRLQVADLDRIADREAADPRHRSIWRAIEASTEELADVAMQRFTELAVFELERPIASSALTVLWRQTGGLSQFESEELLTDLAERSLIELHELRGPNGTVIQRLVSQHDLLRDYTSRIAGDVRLLHGKLLLGYSHSCVATWAHGPDDGYYLDHLCWHLHKAGRDKTLTRLLLDFRWMARRLVQGGVVSLLRDYEYCPIKAESDLGVLNSALRMSASVVSRPADLAGHLHGHLITIRDPTIRRLLETIEVGGPWLQPSNLSLRQAGSPLLGAFHRPSAKILGIAVLRHGQHLATVSSDRALVILDLNSGAVVPFADESSDVEQSLAAQPNPKGVERLGDRTDAAPPSVSTPLLMASAIPQRLLACFPDGQASLWFLDPEAPRRWYSGVSAAALSSNGQVLITVEGEFILSRDVFTGRQLHKTEVGSRVSSVVPLSCGDRVLVVVDEERSHVLKIVRLSTGVIESSLPGGHFDLGPWMTWSSYGDEDVGGRYVIHTDGFVNAVALSSDERYVVSASRDTTINVWDLVAGRLMHCLVGHTGTVNSLAVLPNSTLVVSTSSDRSVRLWDVAVGRLLRTFIGHTRAVYSVAVTPDGKRAISSDEETILVWDLDAVVGEDSLLEFQRASLRRARSMLPTLPWEREPNPQRSHTPEPIDLVVARPGRHQVLAVARNVPAQRSSSDNWLFPGLHANAVFLADLTDGTMRRVAADLGTQITALAVTPDGETMLAASDGKLQIRHIEGPLADVDRAIECDQRIVGISVSSDGKKATLSCGDGMERSLQIEQGMKAGSPTVRTDEGGGSIPICGEILEVSHAISSLASDEVTVLGKGEGHELRWFHEHSMRAGAIRGTSVIAAGDDSSIRLLDVVTGKEQRCLLGHLGPVESLAWTNDGRHVISAGGVLEGGTSLLAWNVGEDSPRSNMMWHFGPVSALEIARDGCLAVSAAEDGTLKIWDLSRGSVTCQSLCIDGKLVGLAMMPDGDRVLTCSAGRDGNAIRVWDVENGELLGTIGGHHGLFSGINSIAILADGHSVASASPGCKVCVWDLDGQTPVREFKGHGSFVNAVAALPDGMRLVSASADHTLKVWDLQSGQEILTLTGHTSYVNAVACLPGGRVVSAAADCSLRIWDVETGSELATLQGHESFVNAVATLPQGPWIISASADRSLRLWDADRGTEVARVTAEAGLRCCAVSSNGTIMAGDDEGWIYVLQFRGEKLRLAH